jgi:5'-nucleotidase
MDASGVESLSSIVLPFTVLRNNVGLVGVITNTTAQLSNPGAVEFFEPAQTVQAAVDTLRSRGIKKIIAVSHNGYHEDIDVAARTSGINLIVGGHSHSLLTKQRDHPESEGFYPTEVVNLEGKTTFVVQAKAWGKYVGILEMAYNEFDELVYLDGDTLLLDTDIEEDPSFKRIVNDWATPFEGQSSVVIGESREGLDYKHCAKGECALGNLITDAMLDSKPSGIRVHGAVKHSNGIRSSLDVGPITVGQVINMLPFENNLVYANYTGQQIREAFENGLSGRTVQGEAVLSMLQVSGLRVRYSFDRPRHNRVLSLQLTDNTSNTMVDIADDQVYSLLLACFLTKGGDNLFTSPPLYVSEPLKRLDNMLIEYIQKLKVIDPRVGDRLLSEGVSDRR